MGKITIVGLGAGPFGLITMETWDKISQAETLLFRTAKHPTIAEIERRGVAVKSFDDIYETAPTFEAVYKMITDNVIKLAKQGKEVVYAVPGSPLVAEKTVVLIRDKAMTAGIECEILPGMSFVEVLYVQLGIDPIDGLTIVDAGDVEDLPVDLKTSIVITQVYNEQIASDTKLNLMELYPDDYEIVLLQNLGLPNEKLTKLPLYELDRQAGIDHLTSVFVPKQSAVQQQFTMEPLAQVMKTLRSPGGCPWDIEQEHASLRRYLIEEVYEVIEAIDLQDADLLCEELGDLLLQIVFHARIAEEYGEFSMQDVIDGVTAKMINRHPHVFGDISVKDAAEVLVNWDEIKKQEKNHTERKSVLDGVPMDLPALLKADKLQHKAAKVGFDWDNIAPVWDKINEELAEVRAAVDTGNQSEIEAEIGDVLFSVVNLARFLKVDGETALGMTNRKFRERFQYVEEQVNKSSKEWNEFTLNELDSYWNDAKMRKI